MPFLSMTNVLRVAKPFGDRTPYSLATFLSLSAYRGKLSFSLSVKSC
jgi:hypothetical protein